MGFPISALHDDFENNLIDPAWIGSAAGSATVTEAAGRATITLPSSTAGSHEAGYVSTARYDITGDGCYININTMVATGVAANAYFDLRVDNTSYVRWRQVSNTISARKVLAGVDTQLFSATWSATTYKYLRIREAGGTIYFDSSTNGTSWTNRAQIVGLPFSVTDMYIVFGALCGNVASPGTFKLDDFNLILGLSSTWRWTQVEWPLSYRFRSVTLDATSGQGAILIADSIDSAGAFVNPRYFAGPLGNSGGSYNQMVEYSTLAAAQAMAVNLPVDDRWDLPNIEECRIIRLYHRSITGSAYIIREYYPRRLVQSDDIEAESIRAINIAAGVITADKIYAIFTITGKTIQTNTGNPRAVMNGDQYGGFIGYGAADTFDPVANTGTYQLLWSKNDGRLYAGGGSVVLGDTGITFQGSDTIVNWIKWNHASAGGDFAAIVGSYATTTDEIYLRCDAPNVTYPNDSRIHFQARNYVGSTRAEVVLRGAEVALWVNAGISVSTSTPGAMNPGEAYIAGNTGMGVAVNAGVRTYIKGADTGSTNYSVVVQDSASTQLFAVRNDGTLYLGKTGGVIQFFGSGGAGKPTVTGSRGGVAALGSLLTALANLGLLTDSSSA